MTDFMNKLVNACVSLGERFCFSFCINDYLFH